MGGMGILVPAEFPMASLKNDAERVVVTTLVDRLTDGWVVLPAIGMSALRDHHPDQLRDPVLLSAWLQHFDPETATMPLWTSSGAAPAAGGLSPRP